MKTKTKKKSKKSTTKKSDSTKKNPCRVIYPRRKIGKGKKAKILRVKRKICY